MIIESFEYVVITFMTVRFLCKIESACGKYFRGMNFENVYMLVFVKFMTFNC